MRKRLVFGFLNQMRRRHWAYLQMIYTFFPGRLKKYRMPAGLAGEKAKIKKSKTKAVKTAKVHNRLKEKIRRKSIRPPPWDKLV